MPAPDGGLSCLLATKTDRTDRTPGAWRAKFLAELAKTSNVSAACKAAGVSRSTAYEARDGDEAFASSWDDAIDEATDALEAEARRRAIEGVDRPVFYQGGECGHVREFSDALLMFLLKAHRPKKFRENVQVEHQLPGVVKVHLAFDAGSDA